MNYYLLFVTVLALALVPIVYGFAHGGGPSTFLSTRHSSLTSAGSLKCAHRGGPSTSHSIRRRSLAMKSGNSLTTTNVQLSNCEVTLRGLVMTDALQSKIEGKIIGVVSKLGENMVTSTHITMSIDPRTQSCDVRCNMKGGALVEAKEHAENMYASIDLVSKTLSNNLKKFREKTKDKKQDGGKLGGTATEDELDIINEV